VPPINRKHVLVFAGGGLTHVSGGIGTLLRAVIHVWVTDPAAIAVRVIDTRGAGGRASAGLHFARALGALFYGCATRQALCAHIHMTTRGSAVRKSILCVLARRLGLPVIVHLHGADFFDFQDRLARLPRALLRAALRQADTILVIGIAWRTRLVRDLGIDPARVTVVPNGVEAASPTTASRSPAHILFLGRIGERKGVGDLITALASPLLAPRSWTATIAGDGDGAAYAERIAALGLDYRISMPGWQSAGQVASLLGSASILVLPSYHEVMPMAVLEAMARGIAIVTTPVGAVPEILRHGESALLIPPGAPDRLAEALARLIDNPADRIRLGEAARAVWAARLDATITASALQSIYRQLAPGAHENAAG
jgi:glycosyltransferase involved in cell wall biosynthesis